ncbi:MAG: hypothetical protein IJF33_01310 [Clostridia bacterium]|nr:hypothetical protein [Clostridia bacterium]
MQLDKKMLDRVLMMNDEQLGELIRRIATEAGVDPAALGLNTQNIQGVRQALGSATEEDVKELNAVYESYKQNRHP